MLHNFKSELKLFLIVAAVSAVLAVGGVWLLKTSQSPQDNKQTFASQEECEVKTGFECSFVMCDYNPPGKTFDEICGKNFTKGWVPIVDKLLEQEPAINNQQSEVDTSGWQTYRSEEFGFEVKYPQTWEELAVPPEHYSSFSFQKKDTIQGVVRIEVSIGKIEAEIWHELSMLDENEKYIYRAVIYTKLEDTVLSGVPAIRYSAKLASGAPLQPPYMYREQVILKQGGKIFNFALVTDSVAKEEDIATFEQILSTFRFVENGIFSSGIEGTTSYVVVSGVPGGQNTKSPASLEFAVAPIENGNPAYAKAMFVTSDAEGKYKAALPPGEYWIGPKEKVLDPINYAPPASGALSEERVVVKQDARVQIDLSVIGYAP